jgi:hypothetical protein
MLASQKFNPFLSIAYGLGVMTVCLQQIQLIQDLCLVDANHIGG